MNLRQGSRWQALMLVAVAMVLLLSACGGGGSTDTAGTRSDSRSTESTTASTAALNSVDLQAAEQAALRADQDTDVPIEEFRAGQAVPKRAYDSGEVVRKATAVSIPVYRFYNTQTTAHFYTTSETEKANVLATMPQFHLEGTAFHGASASSPGLSPVYRFYNYQTGVHFYTISESEKNSVLANLPQFVLEGPAYYASQVSGQGLTPLYRFYVPAKGFHFYTASSTERDSIIANLASTYSYEGVGYYVLASNWSADKLPHTGVTTGQCYGTNLNTSSEVFGTCTTAPNVSAAPQGRQQDALRTSHNPMSYQSYSHRVGGLLVFEPVTNCVFDSVTGLVWEGKTASGQRAGSNLYTGFNTTNASDVGGYVAAVNASALCGFTDWRVPSVLELASLANFGQTTDGPTIHTSWFPHSQSDVGYWASEQRGAITYSFRFERLDLRDQLTDSAELRHVRLVRGTLGSGGTRYTFSTAPYGSDAANNVVNDAVTGLQWRRCLEGQTWTGSACSGTHMSFTHREALAYADNEGRYAAGWRLPSAKEAHSLMNRQKATALRIDSTVFPNVNSSAAWTSTPLVSNSSAVFSINLSEGLVSYVGRNNHFSLRLVR